MTRTRIRSISKKRAAANPDLVKAGRTVKSKKRPRPRNQKRAEKAFAWAYHSVERVEWVNTLPCVISASDHEGAIENAHVTGDGTSRKAGYELVVPMCHGHHHRLHTIGVISFMQRYKAQLFLLAQKTHAAWLAHLAESGDASRVLGGAW